MSAETQGNCISNRVNWAESASRRAVREVCPTGGPSVASLQHHEPQRQVSDP